MLKANGKDVKVVQESLRHAAFQITVGICTQAVNQAVRAAQSKIVEQLGAPKVAGKVKFGGFLDPNRTRVLLNSL